MEENKKMKNNLEKVKLSEISFYSKEKIDVISLNKGNYISTENMLPNKNGISFATTIPKIKTTQYFKIGDILVSNIRPYFKKIWYARFNGGASNDVLIFRNKDNIDSKFLYYILADDRFFEYCMTTSKGTKMPRGDKNSIMNFLVPKFILETQRKIAKILSDIDDKIELNNKINENLEQQAQAIFKSWFIDFEPFGGKMPKDFFKQSILENPYCKLISPGIPNFNNTKYYVATADVNEKGIINKTNFITNNNRPSRANMNPCVNSIWFAKMKNSKKNILINEMWSDEIKKFILSTGFYGLEIKQDALYFLWCFISSDIFDDIKNNLCNGTTMEAINNNSLNKIELIFPTIDILNKFNNLVSSSFKLIAKNNYENEQLANLRDTLLPKLMSGELDVENVDIKI